MLVKEKHKSCNSDFIWKNLLPGWHLKRDEQGENADFHNSPKTRDALCKSSIRERAEWNFNSTFIEPIMYLSPSPEKTIKVLIFEIAK